MIDLKNVRSLSEFQRNARAHIRRLKQTGKPEVLTVNGQAEVVVQSAEGYQRLLDAADLAESVRILKERISAADQSTDGVPATEVLAELRARLGLAKPQ